MSKKEQILDFLERLDDNSLKDYSDRLYESLKDIETKEDKLLFWFVVLLILYLFGNVGVDEVNLIFINIKDFSLVSKISPLIMGYLLFQMVFITSHKKEMLLALDVVFEKRFKDKPIIEEKYGFRKLVSRLFLPFSITNSLSSIFDRKRSIIESFVGFILLLPILLIGLVPTLVYVLMIINLYKNYTNDLIGWICFCLSIWIFLIFIYISWIKSEK